MAKLHEILAVGGDAVTTANKVNEEAIGTFTKKPDHFLRSVTSVEHLSDDERNLDTTEHKDMVTTVFEKLRYLIRSNARAHDITLSKEATNQKAMADIEIDGKTIASNVPATFLLGLENKLAELRKVYEAMPTLAPGPEWLLDPTLRSGGGVYRSVHPDQRFRTRKSVRPIILVPATQHHPAQVTTVNEDPAVAKVTVQTWSGMISSAQKSDLLGRVDQLRQAVKRARQRANNVEVDNRKIGEAMFEFIHNGIVS
jgi:hypothetical protein